MRVKRAIKNIIATLVYQIIAVIGGLIVPKMIIQTYGSDTNGLINSITQFLGYITLLQFGIGPVVKSTLYKPIANKDKKEIQNILLSTEKFFRIIALILTLYIIGLCLVYPLLVNENFNTIYTVSLIIIIAISTFAEYFFGMTYSVYLNANQESYVVSYITSITYVLNAILVVILMKIGAKVHIVKLVSSFIFILKPLLQNIYVKKKYKINLKEANPGYKLENKWEGLAQHIASAIHDHTDVTLLTIFSNIIEVSVYTVYSSIVGKLKSLITVVSASIEATFGDMIAKGENNKLNTVFDIYEYVYHTIVTTLYICLAVLIIPFVSVYTKNITDANYIRPTFALILVTAEFIRCIREPYMSITYAAGHFKQTKIGAWVETITNLIVSIVLVFKYGIVGVAIGTLVAMIFRTSEFIYHASKYVLNRSVITAFLRLIVIAFEFVIVEYIFNAFKFIEVANYLAWLKYTLIVGIVTFLVVFSINTLIYNKSFRKLLDYLKLKIKT